MSTPDTAIESTLVENRVFPPSEATVKAARISGMDGYNALCAEAEKDFEGFWARLARENLIWNKPFTQTLDESNAPFYKWFDDGELNASLQLPGPPHGHAGRKQDRHHFREPTTARSPTSPTRNCSPRSASSPTRSRHMGMQKGDRVLIYMPMTVEGVVAMQACARIGATHTRGVRRLLGQGLQERIMDAGAVAVITANYQMRGGKELPLKAIVDEGIAMGGCESIKNVIVYQRTADRLQHGGRPRQPMHEVTGQGQAPMCEPECRRRRAPAVRALHLRLHRQAQGRAAQPPAATCCGPS